VIVGVLFEKRGRFEPVKVAAEFFDSGEFADYGQPSFVFSAFGRVRNGKGRFGWGVACGTG
jgi:hypothetical protein